MGVPRFWLVLHLILFISICTVGCRSRGTVCTCGSPFSSANCLASSYVTSRCASRSALFPMRMITCGRTEQTKVRRLSHAAGGQWGGSAPVAPAEEVGRHQTSCCTTQTEADASSSSCNVIRPVMSWLTESSVALASRKQARQPRPPHSQPQQLLLYKHLFQSWSRFPTLWNTDRVNNHILSMMSMLHYPDLQPNDTALWLNTQLDYKVATLSWMWQSSTKKTCYFGDFISMYLLYFFPLWETGVYFFHWVVAQTFQASSL